MAGMDGEGDVVGGARRDAGVYGAGALSGRLSVTDHAPPDCVASAVTMPGPAESRWSNTSSVAALAGCPD